MIHAFEQFTSLLIVGAFWVGCLGLAALVGIVIVGVAAKLWELI